MLNLAASCETCARANEASAKSANRSPSWTRRSFQSSTAHECESDQAAAALLPSHHQTFVLELGNRGIDRSPAQVPSSTSTPAHCLHDFGNHALARLRATEELPAVLPQFLSPQASLTALRAVALNLGPPILMHAVAFVPTATGQCVLVSRDPCAQIEPGSELKLSIRRGQRPRCSRPVQHSSNGRRPVQTDASSRSE